MKSIVLTLFICSTFFLAEAGFAQTGGFAGNATRIGFSPNSMAMGNAVTADPSNGIYPYYNPALAAVYSADRQIDLTASSLEFDRIFMTAGAHFQLPPNAGISFGLIRTGVKDIDGRSISGYPQGTFDASEYQLLTAFGIRLSEKVNAGIGFKLNYANYHEDLEAATAVGVDFGLLFDLSESINLGLTVQDLFANYTWNSAELYNLSQTRNVANNFPTRYKAAISYQSETFVINSELEVQSLLSEVNSPQLFITDGSTPGIINTTEEVNTNAVIFRTGGSWNAHERFTLRAGYIVQDSGSSGNGSFSGGFSIHLPFDTFAPSIDYAFVAEPNKVSNMHVFALRLHL
jgi:hypothetical protein